MSGLTLNNNLLNNNRTPFKMEVSVVDSETFTIPQISGYNYNYRVNWGDENYARVTSYDDTNAAHTYTSAGTYVIEILGLNEAVYFNNGGNKLNVTKILQWGTTNFKIINFYGCENMTSICEVVNNRELLKITSLENSFRDTGITSIPLFLNNSVDVASFKSTFRNSSITEIPAHLFDYNTKVTSVYAMFNICTGITSIPVDLLKYNTALTNVGYLFSYCTGITSIPVDLLKYNTKVISVYAMFNICTAITSIPANLLNYNTALTNVGYLFSYCTGITSIPANLITPALHPNLTSLYRAFYQCTSINTTVYEIWNLSWTGTLTNHTECFYGDTNITNYADIPTDWK